MTRNPPNVSAVAITQLQAVSLQAYDSTEAGGTAEAGEIAKDGDTAGYDLDTNKRIVAVENQISEVMDAVKEIQEAFNGLRASIAALGQDLVRRSAE